MHSRHLLILAATLAVLIFAACTAPSPERRAESTSCGNYMCSICVAARTWAMDNADYLPSDFLSMSNEVSSPRILICPGDHSRRPAADWASFTSDQSSYEL